MDQRQLALYLQEKVPEHLNNMCEALELFSQELEATKKQLSENTGRDLCNGDYASAREAMEAHEELSHIGASVSRLSEQFRRPEETPPPVVDNAGREISTVPVTNRRPKAFSFNGRTYPISTWKALLLKVCELLCKEDASVMIALMEEEQRNGRRAKLSMDAADFRTPARIPGTALWVETHSSADRIRGFILTLLQAYDIPFDRLQVFL